jgi:hypothetical protein
MTSDIDEEGRQALRTLVLGIATDAGSDFYYYDRKNDEDLPMGVIEQAIEWGVVTRAEIGEAFAGADSDEQPIMDGEVVNDIKELE